MAGATDCGKHGAPAVTPARDDGPRYTMDDRRQRLRRSIVLGAVGFGLIGGISEVAILAVRLRWLKESLLLSQQFVWMVPAVSVAFCVGLGVILRCAAVMFTSALSPRIALFALAVLGVLGPLLALPSLHYAVAGGLAAVLGGLIAWFMARQLDRSLALAPRVILVALALVACAGMGVNGRRVLAERRALAQLPAAAPHAPNVVLIVLDTVRAASLSLYGYAHRTTPELERLAATSVVFDTALSASPWTLPSHATMFTGHWPHEVSTGWKESLDGRYPTLAEILRAHGYVTAGFVGNLIYGSTFHGLNRGFVTYHDFPVSIGQALLSSSLGVALATNDRLRYWLNYHRVLNRKTAAEVNADFLAWLSSRRDGRPFFAFLNYMDAHEPYLPPRSYVDRFGPARRRVKFWHTGIDAFRPNKWEMSPQEVQAEFAEYEGAIAYIDDQLGKLVGALEKRSLLDDTVVIIVSDHGEQLGEHGLFAHGNSLYRQLLHVPLLISFRRHVPAGRVVHAPVTLRDLPATILDLAGLADPPALPGTSLARYWRDPDGGAAAPDALLLAEASQRVFGVHPWYPLSKGDMQSLIGGGYHYIKNGDGSEELYDFQNDAAEERNLADTDVGRRIIAQRRESLTAMLAASPQPAAESRRPRDVDAGTRDRMRALGY